ncbi:MAG: biotin transporter BioY [Ancalomicrobiaceae bacterium]|nr:biotin transporter BioY [Ancalomicrobiaceae bacterium]
MSTATPTLADTTLAAIPAVPRKVALAIAGTLLIWISAKVQVPFYPVPMTLQTLAVLGIGLVYGGRLGAATLLLYLAEGALGLPVFAGTPEKGIGLAYMMGPTGGYLVGYALAAFVTGALAERGFDRRMSTTALAMLAGNVAIYVPGLVWLGVCIGWDKPVLALGLVPFFIGDVVKLALAAFGLPAIRRLCDGRRN